MHGPGMRVRFQSLFPSIIYGAKDAIIARKDRELGNKDTQLAQKDRANLSEGETACSKRHPHNADKEAAIVTERERALAEREALIQVVRAAVTLCPTLVHLLCWLRCSLTCTGT